KFSLDIPFHRTFFCLEKLQTDKFGTEKYVPIKRETRGKTEPSFDLLPRVQFFPRVPRFRVILSIADLSQLVFPAQRFSPARRVSYAENRERRRSVRPGSASAGTTMKIRIPTPSTRCFRYRPHWPPAFSVAAGRRSSPCRVGRRGGKAAASPRG